MTPNPINSQTATFTADLDLDVPEQQDGKGGPDEIGQDGEDCSKCSAFTSVSGKRPKTNLLEQSNKQRQVCNGDERNKPIKTSLQLAELRQPQQKETYRDLGDGEGKNRLHPIQVIPFQEHLEIKVGKIIFVSTKTAEHHAYVESKTDGVSHLCFCQQAYDGHSAHLEPEKAYGGEDNRGIVPS
ncbi:MAG: hypothetical protein Q9198_001339 [Flavoplaca austrocitrina]